MIPQISQIIERKCKITPQNQKKLGDIAIAITNHYKDSNAVKVLNAGKENIVIEYCDTYVKKPKLRIAVEPLNTKNIDGDTFYDEEILLSHDYSSLADNNKFSFRKRFPGREREEGNAILDNLIPKIIDLLQNGKH